MEKKLHCSALVDLHIGNRIKSKRTILGLSQQQLADNIGISCQQIQKYEYGKNALNANRLLEISNSLKEPVAFFFNGLPQQNFDCLSNLNNLTRETIEFV